MTRTSACLFVLIAIISLGCGFFSVDAPPPQFNRGTFILQADPVNKAYIGFLRQDTAGNLLNYFQDVYTMQNRTSLDGTPNAIAVHQGRGYVLDAERNQILVLNSDTWTPETVITSEVDACQQMTIYNDNLALVSCWSLNTASSVVLLDLNGLRAVDRFQTGNQPAHVVVDSAYAIVAHTGDSTVRVLNPLNANDPYNYIYKLDGKPAGLAVGLNRQVWVLYNGKTSGVLRIDYKTQTRKAFEFENKPNAQFNQLVINRNRNALYFNYQGAASDGLSGIHRFPISSNNDTMKVYRFSAPVNRHQLAQMRVDFNTNILYASVKEGSPGSGHVLRFKLPAGNTGSVAPSDSFRVKSQIAGFAFRP
jgi:hypothetical protein